MARACASRFRTIDSSAICFACGFRSVIPCSSYPDSEFTRFEPGAKFRQDDIPGLGLHHQKADPNLMEPVKMEQH